MTTEETSRPWRTRRARFGDSRKPESSTGSRTKRSLDNSDISHTPRRRDREAAARPAFDQLAMMKIMISSPTIAEEMPASRLRVINISTPERESTHADPGRGASPHTLHPGPRAVDCGNT